VRRVLAVLAGVVVVALAALLLLPAPVDPAAYAPPSPPPLSGALTPNLALREAERLLEGEVHGPEDVAFDADGRLYASTADGKVVRLAPGGRAEDFAVTGGRPLGLRFDPRGNLVVCDSYRGLLSVDPGGRITVLATEAAGVPFRFTDNLDVARDGTIYFSDASSKFGQDQYLYDLLEARPHGRLLRHDPLDGRTRVLLPELAFANGVALQGAEEFLLVGETYRYRVLRHWLKGPRAGTTDVFADNLPGFPDNIGRGPRGTFWVALFTVRNPLMDALHPRPWAKRLLSKLPRFAWPRPAPYGLVLELDEEGRVLRSLHDPGGERVTQVTTAREHEGHLYLGTLHERWIGRLALPLR
jgi:sugar lactone lactonase YvrE